MNMVSVNDAASYIYYRYRDEYGCVIDEMKLHKLMYFAQRESLIQTGNPLFKAVFLRMEVWTNIKRNSGSIQVWFFYSCNGQSCS